MTNTPELDAAIKVAEIARDEHARAYNYETVLDLKRTYARALIGKLLEGMDGNDLSVLPEIHPAAVVWGFNAAIKEVSRRAGIEEQST